MTDEQNATGAAETPEQGEQVSQAQEAPNQPENGSQEPTGGSERPYEDVVSDLKKVREEAANWRVKYREAEKALAEAKSPEDFEALRSELETTRKEYDKKLLVGELTRELPTELVSVTQWPDGADDIKALVKTLAKFVNAQSNPQELHGGLDPRSDRSEDNASPAELAARYNRRVRR